MRTAATLSLLLIGLAAFARSQPDDTRPFQPNVLPALEIRRVAAPIQIDGELDDPGWQEAVAATNFAEIRPGDQSRPLVNTEALVAYSDTHLYLAFKAADSNPGAIRASLRDRDQMWQDDFVGIILDTYGDGAWAYEIFANPLGVQGDARWTAENEDDGFNLIFASQGKITAAGYQVEMAIPFSSLRFPDKPKQNWRITFFRTHPRDSRRQYSWASVSRDNPCFPCQFGTLTGINNVKPAGKLELLPAVIAFQSGRWRDWEDPGAGLANSKVDGEASLGVQFAFTPSLTAEATYNPDFSQIESDASQIDVNTTFALFYPERRPFFQEGSDLFNTWFNVFYTRSINNPVLATKLVGRLNRTSIGYVLARDENSPVILPFEERSAFLSAGRSTSNVLRLKRTFLEDSYLGALITDRRLEGGGAGSIISIDGLWRFRRNYRLELQALLSHTQEPDNAVLTAEISERQSTFDRGQHTTAFDGESFWGNAVYASFEREARHWSFDFDYVGSSATFRADNGFITGNDQHQFVLWNGYDLYPNTRVVDRLTPSLVFGRFFNYAGERKDDWIRPRLNLQLKAQTSVFLGSVFSTERFRGKEFPGIRRLEIEVNSNFSKPLNLGFWLAHGRFIARNLADPVLGSGTDLQAWATIRPLSRLVIEPSFLHARLRHPNHGPEIFNGYIARTRLNYQFTRELFLRLVAQYNDFDQVLNIEPLLSYKLNPFTIFYLGTTHAFEELGAHRDFTQTQRQFFMKFQYLLRV
ncbi:MAG: hypothetical protein DKINENOH_00051 [bacterium]|nr:hypothetical protein [bacterium]